MSAWYSIEVFDGATPASVWAEGYQDALIESALAHGAKDWSWHRHTWGVVFEVCFEDEETWDSYMTLANVAAALDAVPDPVTGLIVYKGRGGSSGSPFPRKPKPLAGSGSAALPIPWELTLEDFFSAPPITLARPVLAGTGAIAFRS